MPLNDYAYYQGYLAKNPPPPAAPNKFQFMTPAAGLTKPQGNMSEQMYQYLLSQKHMPEKGLADPNQAPPGKPFNVLR